MTMDKAFKLGTVLVSAFGIIFSIVFFCLNAFDTSKTKFYNGYFALILIVMIALTIYLARFLLLDKEWSYSKIYLVLAIGWSICMQLVMPPISGADEVQHFYSAYHCSNIYLGIKDHDFDTTPGSYGNWIEGTSYFYMRAEDYYKLPYIDVTFPYQYQILADGNWFHTDDDMKELVQCYTKPTQRPRYCNRPSPWIWILWCSFHGSNHEQLDPCACWLDLHQAASCWKAAAADVLTVSNHIAALLIIFIRQHEHPVFIHFADYLLISQSGKCEASCLAHIFDSHHRGDTHTKQNGLHPVCSMVFRHPT